MCVEKYVAEAEIEGGTSVRRADTHRWYQWTPEGVGLRIAVRRRRRSRVLPRTLTGRVGRTLPPVYHVGTFTPAGATGTLPESVDVQSVETPRKGRVRRVSFPVDTPLPGVRRSCPSLRCPWFRNGISFVQVRWGFFHLHRRRPSPRGPLPRCRPLKLSCPSRVRPSLPGCSFSKSVAPPFPRPHLLRPAGPLRRDLAPFVSGPVTGPLE